MISFNTVFYCVSSFNELSLISLHMYASLLSDRDSWVEHTFRHQAISYLTDAVLLLLKNSNMYGHVILWIVWFIRIWSWFLLEIALFEIVCIPGIWIFVSHVHLHPLPFCFSNYQDKGHLLHRCIIYIYIEFPWLSY